MTTVRGFFAWLLLAYAGAELFFIVLSFWLPGSGGDLPQRSYRVDTTTVTTVALPILALLLSAWVKPVLRIAKTVALLAFAAYLIILVFGILTFSLGIWHIFEFLDDSTDALAVMSHVVFAMLGFIIAALCAVTCWRYYSGRDPFQGAVAGSGPAS